MRQTILVIEKDRQIRETVACMLEAISYRAVGFGSMQRALLAMQGVMFDAIIVGSNATSSIESSDPEEAKSVQPGIKIIIATGAILPRSLSLHADAVLYKPFGLNELAATLGALLKKPD